jgi:hypothetical protein
LQKSQKLSNLRTGPFTITKVITDVNYEITLDENSDVKRTVHRNHLVEYYPIEKSLPPLIESYIERDTNFNRERTEEFYKQLNENPHTNAGRPIIHPERGQPNETTLPLPPPNSPPPPVPGTPPLPILPPPPPPIATPAAIVQPPIIHRRSQPIVTSPGILFDDDPEPTSLLTPDDTPHHQRNVTPPTTRSQTSKVPKKNPPPIPPKGKYKIERKETGSENSSNRSPIETVFPRKVRFKEPHDSSDDQMKTRQQSRSQTLSSPDSESPSLDVSTSTPRSYRFQPSTPSQESFDRTLTPQFSNFPSQDSQGNIANYPMYYQRNQDEPSSSYEPQQHLSRSHSLTRHQSLPSQLDDSFSSDSMTYPIRHPSHRHSYSQNSPSTHDDILPDEMENSPTSSSYPSFTDRQDSDSLRHRPSPGFALSRTKLESYKRQSSEAPAGSQIKGKFSLRAKKPVNYEDSHTPIKKKKKKPPPK